MKNFVYSIFENGVYTVPFTITSGNFEDANYIALKSFKTCLSDSTSELIKLVFLGTFDKFSGQFTKSINEHNVIASYCSFIERYSDV